MATLIRQFDWSNTSLGPVALWPDTLVTTVNLLLASRHPMFLWWGPELIQFYNDGYRPSIRADKHPSAVGQRGPECWPEIWSIIGPQIASVMTEGRSTWNINQLVPINRDGKLEEVYWTYSYSPVRDNAGIIQGALVVCSETTDQVLTERRLKTLLDITAHDRSESEISQSLELLPFAREIIATLGREPGDLPFAVLYHSHPSESICVGISSAADVTADALCLQLNDLLHSSSSIRVEDLQKRVGSLICKPWPEPVTRACVLPLAMPGSPSRTVFIFGISPRLPFDDRYETFMQLVAARIAGLLHSETQRLDILRAAVRFRLLTEANPFGMVIGTLHGELNYISPVLLKSLGYSEEDVRMNRVRWDNLTPPEYTASDARAVEQLRNTGQCEVYEKVYRAKDGRLIPILIGAATIDSLEGEAEVAAFVTDLTPLKKAEEALRRANDELEMKVAERTAALETEVAERKRMELSLRDLTSRLLNMRDEERRHMARELHDNAGQTLAVLSMHLSAIETASRVADKSADTPGDLTALKNAVTRIAGLAADSRQFSDDLSREIRTLSYLLHPPLLDEVGLDSALRWYVDGFSERSKIKVDIDLPVMERLPREIELVLFRVVQESLTNVHRHSGSSTAGIRLTRFENLVQVEITDGGKGISTEKQLGLAGAKTGVGVRGMEERVRQFGGTLQIASSPSGTRVTVCVPVPMEDRDEAAN